ncbi:MAG TPA: glycine--tRNA ligase subunit beta [Thermoanaerobaculia bacterium]|nr:glycine--tRNA ligase subunit beta [Thermoanaerobaculia bacterium]
MGELLIELRCGAVPPARAAAWARRLKERLVAALRAVDLAPRQSAVGYSGRRLMVLLRGVGDHPRSAGGPEERRARVAEAVVEALELLAVAVARPGSDLRRGACRAEGLLAVLDGEALAVQWQGLAARAESEGHRASAGGRFAVGDADSYRLGLEEAGVEIRFAERRRALQRRIAELLGPADLALEEDPALVDLLAAECEAPEPVLGSFEGEHLALPWELVRAVLRERQQVFTVLRGGRPAAMFLAVVDHPPPAPSPIVAGYELSVHNLLDDVGFHWARDRSLPVAERARRVAAGMRAGGDSVEVGRAGRLRSLARAVCEDAGWHAELESVDAAIELLRADLDTSLGREFPELLGVIGALLARAEGHPESVWRAMYDHPLPIRPRSTLPRGRAALAVAVADRADRIARDCCADTLAEVTPAAARDLVRLLMHGGVASDPDLVVARACRELGGAGGREAVARARSLLDEAVEGVLGSEGLSAAEVRAVRAAQGSSLPTDVLARARGLVRLRGAQGMDGVVATARRLVDILRQAPEGRLDPSLLVDRAEVRLHQVYLARQAAVRGLLAEGRTEDWLAAMLELNETVESFLADVLIHDEVERVRLNRLALLQAVQHLYAGELSLAELDARIEGR